MTAKLTPQQIRDMQARMGDDSQQHYALGCMDDTLKAQLNKISPLISEIRDLQHDIPDQARLSVWEVLTLGYCIRCGSKLKKWDAACTCTKDE